MNSPSNQPACLLRTALFSNALFSTLSALVILLAPRWVLRLLGLSQDVSLKILGFALIFFAITLLINARRPRVKTFDAWAAVMMDLAWVVGSGALLFLVPFSTSGKWVVTLVADLVLVFAILQFAGIRRMQKREQTS